MRTIFRCAIEPRTIGLATATDDNWLARGVAADDEGRSTQAYDIVVEGDGFLYKMVRLIAGTLVTVGMGLAPPESVLTALATAEVSAGASAAAGASVGTTVGTPSASRRSRGVVGVGPTLPPERLCLEHVEYDTDYDTDHVAHAPRGSQ